MCYIYVHSIEFDITVKLQGAFRSNNTLALVVGFVILFEDVKTWLLRMSG